MNGTPLNFGAVDPVEYAARMLAHGMTRQDANMARPAMLDLVEAMGGDRDSPFMAQLDTAGLYLIALYIAFDRRGK